ncbi:oleosin L-like [Amaranthus tricolor]|uniref:oleosin L-like n=1 Tax=Amaranthus tricolor TaxID=29722 RepID=UPI00258BE275|nr:oleosin L-like [Amaranthus tricolor]
MADYMHHAGPGGHQVTHRDKQLYEEPRAHQVVKAGSAITAGGSLLILSALTLAGTVIALCVATPLLVIFSPVIVPAAITVVLLITGFLASGGLGVAAVSVLAWIYRYMTGRNPRGSNDQLEQARMKLGGKTTRLESDHLGRKENLHPEGYYLHVNGSKTSM